MLQVTTSKSYPRNPSNSLKIRRVHERSLERMISNKVENQAVFFTLIPKVD